MTSCGHFVLTAFNQVDLLHHGVADVAVSARGVSINNHITEQTKRAEVRVMFGKVGVVDEVDQGPEYQCKR